MQTLFRNKKKKKKGPLSREPVIEIGYFLEVKSVHPQMYDGFVYYKNLYDTKKEIAKEYLQRVQMKAYYADV